MTRGGNARESLYQGVTDVTSQVGWLVPGYQRIFSGASEESAEMHEPRDVVLEIPGFQKPCQLL